MKWGQTFRVALTVILLYRLAQVAAHLILQRLVREAERRDQEAAGEAAHSAVIKLIGAEAP